MPSASKNARKTHKVPGRPFLPGHPGGPGRPAGSRNKATLALDALADDAAPAAMAKLTEAAATGDMRAIEILLSRVWPPQRSRRVVLDLPPIMTAADLVAALGKVAATMAAGVITPDEAQAVAAVLESKRRAIETVDLEARIIALEGRK